jgi:uncharacterized protein DUF3999
MKTLVTAVAILLFAGPNISYFRYQRNVQIKNGGQQYFVVDDATWQHARPDLDDLRLFANGREIPYNRITESGSAEKERKDVPVLQQSVIDGKTQFLVNMSDVSEYSRVELKIATKDYVAHAKIDGQDDPHGKKWAALGDGIIYELSSEKLGSNSTLRLPISRFKYLRITLDGPVKPKDVQGASTELGDGRPPIYTAVPASIHPEQSNNDTVFVVDVSPKIPINRVQFTVDPAQGNFWRRVEIHGEHESWLGSGEISRIHIVRSSRRIDSEQYDIPASLIGQGKIRIVVHNGDDPPLKITAVSLQQYERRVYFDTPPQSQLTLYYGDEKLQAPEYDYARLVQLDNNATAAALDAETTNTAYTGRPDDRPWSERHPAILWGAIVAAVLILGALALRNLKGA